MPNRILGELSIPGEAFGSVRISFSARMALSLSLFRLAAAGGGVSGSEAAMMAARESTAEREKERERERERQRESQSCRGMQKGRGPGRVRRVLQIIHVNFYFSTGDFD